MKLKARDSMHVSSVKSDNLVKGEVFDVDDAEGKQLVARGLADRVAAPATKNAAAPANKKKQAPKNKAAAKPNNK